MTVLGDICRGLLAVFELAAALATVVGLVVGMTEGPTGWKWTFRGLFILILVWFLGGCLR